MTFISINVLKIDREDITRRLKHGLTEDDVVEIITLTNEDETLHKKWVKLADKIRPLHASRKEMAGCIDDYRNIIILGFSKEKRKAYNKELKMKKANVVESADMTKLRKLKQKAQGSMSRIWLRILNLCFPAEKLTKTKKEEEEDKQEEEKKASALNSNLTEGEDEGEGDEEEGQSVVSRAQSENDMDVEEDFEDVHPPAAAGGGGGGGGGGAAAAGQVDEGEFIFVFSFSPIFTDPLFSQPFTDFHPQLQLTASEANKEVNSFKRSGAVAVFTLEEREREIRAYKERIAPIREEAHRLYTGLAGGGGQESLFEDTTTLLERITQEFNEDGEIVYGDPEDKEKVVFA